MKKIIALTMILLSGCGYNKSEIDGAKSACESQGGLFTLGTNTGGTVLSTYCTIGNLKYEIGKTEYKMYNATMVR